MKKVIFLIGPTGIGKSEVAIGLAKKIKGEIVSCDSMQMYRGLDIGTAKPTAKERKAVPHHLLDVIHPRTHSSAFRHYSLARRAVHAILHNRKIPIVTGGSGFYVRALTDGIPDSPGTVSTVRRRLEALAAKKGPSFLHERLKKIDPARARAIHPNDAKRMIRALEVYELSKRKPSEFKKCSSGLKDEGVDFVMIGLKRDRQELYRRIERRVDQMFDRGWVSEVKRLRRAGFSMTAREAIGYKEILEYLDGKIDLETAVSIIKKRTRHLAKKQLTWFRKDGRIQWVPIHGSRFQKKAIQRILELYAA